MESISNASSMSVAMTGIVSFALVLVPTLLMGATLPLLVTHLVRGNQNVGQSVGLLYFANTIGAAFGALIGATIWFRFYGLSGSVHIAVILNFASAIVVGLLAITEKSISGKLEAEGK
jgi:predicted membrane-bound spermidine synthase